MKNLSHLYTHQRKTNYKLKSEKAKSLSGFGFPLEVKPISENFIKILKKISKNFIVVVMNYFSVASF